MKLREIAERLDCRLEGDGEVEITRVAGIERAEPGDLTFLAHEKYVKKFAGTHASAVIVSTRFPAVAGKNLVRVTDPRLAFVRVMGMFEPAPRVAVTIHATAVVSPEAALAAGVTVGECTVIRHGARIGRGTRIESGVHIGEGVVIGAGCYLGPNVVVMAGARLGDRVRIHGGTVIGADGFGYVWAEGRHLKIPQLGRVIIEDDVELGANVCVDRATFGSTIIRRGTKVDNLVQIAHNNVIGEDVIITGQVGLSGSVTVGNRVMFGGQSGVVDHVTIGDDARIGAASPVTKDVKPGETVWGFPARPSRRVKRELASLSRLPRLVKQLQAVLRAPAPPKPSRKNPSP